MRKYFVVFMCMICFMGCLGTESIYASEIELVEEGTDSNGEITIMSSSILISHSYLLGTVTYSGDFVFNALASKVIINSMKLQKKVDGSWSTVHSVGPYNFYNCIALDIHGSYQFTTGSYRIQTSITATISGSTSTQTFNSPTMSK